jgi:ABC-2 type transport system permease protein
MKKPTLKFDFKTRHAGVSAITTIAVAAGLIIINILAAELDIQADLTPKKLFSLTAPTIELLDGLDSEVEILALFKPGEEPEAIMESVNEYDRNSDRVSVSVIDPDRNPGVVSRFSEDDQPIPMGSIIVSSGSNFRVIGVMDLYDISRNAQGQTQITGQKVEQQITSAIAYVSSGRTPKILEVTGHRESPLASQGYGSLLDQANYELGEISLIREDIPGGTALVTLIGPRSDLSEAEANKLDEYLAGGGSLLVALDLTQEPLAVIDGLLERWDIRVRRGLVLEGLQNRLIAEFGDNPLVFAPFMTDHEALAPLFEAKMNPIVQATMGFSRTEAEQRQLEYFPLLTSSEDSRLRTDISSAGLGDLAPLPSDEMGPIDVAAAVRQRNLETYQPEGGTVVVLGSASTLAGLGFLGQIRDNADMVLNLVNWAVDDETAVNVSSKSLFRLPLRIGNLTAVIYAGLAIILIPLISMGSGLFIFFRRRNK